MPTPKWKLVVDVGAKPPKPDNAAIADRRAPDLLKLLAEHIPTHRNSPYSPYLPGFTSLRLLLLKQTKTPEEKDLLGTVLESYSSYLSSGRSNSETAWMIARDFMLLSRTSTTRLQQNRAQDSQIPSIHQQPVQHLQGRPIHQFQPEQHMQHGAKSSMQQRQQLQPTQQLQGHVQHMQQASRLLQPLEASTLTSAHSSLHQQALRTAQSHQQMSTGSLQAHRHLTSDVNLQSQQSKQSFLQLDPAYGALTGATQQHQLGIDPSNRNLAPSPGFSLQQSAFHPISQPQGSAQQQSNGGVSRLNFW
jgi:hypothetical protein